MKRFKSTAALFAASCALLAAGPTAAQTKPWPVIEEKAPSTEVRALPGDQFEPRTLPGDQFEPKTLPGDQFEPRTIPGDTFEPKSIPGDTFEPNAIPGDTFEGDAGIVEAPVPSPKR